VTTHDFDSRHITVDFSNSDDDALIFARLARASRVLAAGDEVLATDGEEHACYARVERIEGDVAYLALDWDTWTTFEFTASTGGLTPTELTPTFVQNGGADAQSQSAPISLVEND
jgi:hypothetical protein